MGSCPDTDIDPFILYISGVCLEQNLLTNKRNLSFDEECSSQENASGKKKNFFFISKDIWSNCLFLDEIVKMLNITTLR